MRSALYYALGGGLGHITRARALLRQWGLQAPILTRAEHALHPQIRSDLSLIAVPAERQTDPQMLADWLQALIRRQAPEVLYLDSFPAGLLGEFCAMSLPEGMRVEYIARRLRWDVYSDLLQGPAPRFSRTHLLEPLEPAHRAWLGRRSDAVAALQLQEPPQTCPPACVARFLGLPRPRWLIAHAGPEAEIEELVAYAREQAAAEGLRPALCLAAPWRGQSRGADLLQLDCYPLVPLFPLADRIISACGFNSMRQTEPFRERHRFVPMPRRFDDQFARAALRRRRMRAAAQSA